MKQVSLALVSARCDVVSYFPVRAPSASSDEFELFSYCYTVCNFITGKYVPSPSLRTASTTANTKCHIVTGKSQEVSASRCRSRATFTDVSKATGEVKWKHLQHLSNFRAGIQQMTWNRTNWTKDWRTRSTKMVGNHGELDDDNMISTTDLDEPLSQPLNYRSQARLINEPLKYQSSMISNSRPRSRALAK